MRFEVAAISALAAGVLAVPAADMVKRQTTPTCMTDAEAQNVAHTYDLLIHSDPFPKQLARNALVSNYTDYVDSVIELIDQGCPGQPLPLGIATFTDRKTFIQQQGTQPAIPFELLNVWNNCDTVMLRWRTSHPKPIVLSGSAIQQVTGTVVIEVEQNTDASAPQPWLISTIYSEFNSGAWVVDNGNFTPSCNADGTPSAASRMAMLHKS